MYRFTDITMNWWQLGIFKAATLAVGAIIGAYAHEFVRGYVLVFVVIAIAASTYISWLAMQQADDAADPG